VAEEAETKLSEEAGGDYAYLTKKRQANFSNGGPRSQEHSRLRGWDANPLREILKKTEEDREGASRGARER